MGIGLGAANYWGDLSPNIVLSETKPSMSLFARYNFNKIWAANLQANFMQVSGSDKNFDFNKTRNLSFNSNIREYALLFDYNFSNFGFGVLDKKISAYVFGGLSTFSFNPQTDLNGQTFSLRDLKTEGVAYNTRSYAIPFGLGIKYIFSRHFSLEANYNIRKTYTDYLDDVSATYIDYNNVGEITQQLGDRSYEVVGAFVGIPGHKRGSDNLNDWFMNVSFCLSYRLPGKIKCPKFY